MLNEKIDLLESELRGRLIRALRKNSSWGKIFGDFIDDIRKENLTAYLFGGTVRDLLVLGAKTPPRDLDLVVDSNAFEYFRHQFQFDRMSSNRFGGIKCKFNTFQKGYRTDVTFRSLPSTAFYNLDAIVAEIVPSKGKSRVIHECGFFKGMINRQIDYNLEITEHPELNAVRGFVLAQRTGFHFSNRLCKFLFDLFFIKKRKHYEDIQLQHYKRVRIPEEVLIWNFEQMRMILNKNPQSTYLPVFPKLIQDEFLFDPEPLCFGFAET